MTRMVASQCCNSCLLTVLTRTVPVCCGQDWDDGSVTLAQLNKQEASDRARMQSLGGIVRGGQITEDTAANPEVQNKK